MPSYFIAPFTGPDFVSSIEDEDFVYFFFREEAVEYMNCGKVKYKIGFSLAECNLSNLSWPLMIY